MVYTHTNSIEKTNMVTLARPILKSLLSTFPVYKTSLINSYELRLRGRVEA